MGSALIGGALNAGVVNPDGIVATRRSRAALAELEKTWGVAVETDNARAVQERDVAILAVKPKDVLATLAEIAPHLSPGTLVISVAAGIRLATIEAHLPPGQPVVRAMPNTPSLVGEGAIGYSGGASATAAHLQVAGRLFAAVGRAFVLDESALDAVTGLSGSGPAYAFLMIEALADGGVASGLSRSVALELAAQTLLGAAKLVLQSGKHPAALKDAVMSPAGTTAAGLVELERAGLRGALIQAVSAAARRSQEVS